MSATARRRAESVIQDFKEVTTPASPSHAEHVQRCLVYCRVRPYTKRDFEDGAFSLLQLKGKQVAVQDEKTYEFDGTFQENSNQSDIFEQVAVPSLEHAFQGYCSAILCYGQTGTGKSYTMCSTKIGTEGIIPRAAHFIFEKVAKLPRSCEVTAQFVQIYRDQLSDLMSESGKDKVDIRFEKNEGVTLPGCSSHVLKSEKEFMDLFQKGDAHRVVVATAMNPESSRGHTALVIWIRTQSKDADDLSGEKRGKITFIDLAGYERFTKTGIGNADPIRKDEAKTINASLLSMGHVVSALSNGDKHIPWRNAKLTRLLQDSIGGRSRTTVILTVGPSSDHIHETTNTLQLGMRAMAVKVQSRISVVVDYEKLAAKLQRMLGEKDRQISSLELQVASGDAERAELMERHRRDEEVLRIQHEGELQELREKGASSESILKASERHEQEVQDLLEQQKEEVQYQQEALNREMLDVIDEVDKKTQVQAAEMKLAHDSLIEEFQQKLNDARSGTNADLIRCLQQLADRDATLVSRASRIATLESYVGELMLQLKENGMQPTHTLDPTADAFMDITQVAEMQDRLNNQLEQKNTQLGQLKAQLDKVTNMHRQLQEENAAQKGEIRSMTEKLQKAGIDIKFAEDHQATVIETSVETILEVENVRMELQSEVDRLTLLNSQLQLEIDDSRESAKTVNTSIVAPRVRTSSMIQPSESYSEVKITPRVRACSTIHRPRNLSFNAGESQESPMIGERKILERHGEYATRIMVLEMLLQSNNIAFPESSCLPEEGLQVIIDALHSKGDEAVTSLMASSQGTELNVSWDEYLQVVHKLRDECRELQFQLCLQRYSYHAHSIANKTEERVQQCELSLQKLIADRDEEIFQRDNTIMQQAHAIATLSTCYGELESQIGSAGLSIKTTLPSNVRQIANEHVAKEIEYRAIKQELQDKEEREETLKQVLERMKQDRAEEAMLLAHQKETVVSELEVTKKSAEEQARMAEEAKRKLELQRQEIEAEKKRQDEDMSHLKVTLEEQTRAMMEAQAKAAETEGEEGFFSKLFRKKK